MVNCNFNLNGINPHSMQETFSILKTMRHAVGSAADFISNKYVTHQTDSSGSINKHGVSISQEAFVLRLESLCDSRVYGIENAVRDALFFFENNFRKHGLSFPHVKLIDEKEINLVIDNESLVLDVALFGDHGFSYYVKFKDSDVEHWEDLHITDSLPPRVYDLLRLK